jgi:hypothetical protein
MIVKHALAVIALGASDTKADKAECNVSTISQ